MCTCNDEKRQLLCRELPFMGSATAELFDNFQLCHLIAKKSFLYVSTEAAVTACSARC